MNRWVVTGILVLQTLIAFGGTFYLVDRERRFLADGSAAQAASDARILAAHALPAMAANDLTALNEVVEPFAADKKVAYAMVTDPHGLVLAHSDPEKFGQYLLDSRSLALLKDSAAVRRVDQTDKYVQYAAPVMLEAHQMGWAWIAVDLGAIQSHLDEMRRLGLLYGTCTGLIALLVAFWPSRLFSRSRERSVAATTAYSRR